MEDRLSICASQKKEHRGKKKPSWRGVFSRRITLEKKILDPKFERLCVQSFILLAALKFADYKMQKGEYREKSASGMCVIRIAFNTRKVEKPAWCAGSWFDKKEKKKNSTVLYDVLRVISHWFVLQSLRGEHDFGKWQELKVTDWFEVPLTLRNVTELLIVPRMQSAFCPVVLYTQTLTHILVHALWSRCTCSVLHMHWHMHVSAAKPELQVLPWLVLRLGGGEVILQEALQVLEGGSFLWLFPPAGQHQVVQGFGALCGTWHPVTTLHLVQHFSVYHTWKSKDVTVTIYDTWWHWWVTTVRLLDLSNLTSLCK